MDAKIKRRQSRLFLLRSALPFTTPSPGFPIATVANGHCSTNVPSLYNKLAFASIRRIILSCGPGYRVRRFSLAHLEPTGYSLAFRSGRLAARDYGRHLLAFAMNVCCRRGHGRAVEKPTPQESAQCGPPRAARIWWPARDTP